MCRDSHKDITFSLITLARTKLGRPSGEMPGMPGCQVSQVERLTHMSV